MTLRWERGVFTRRWAHPEQGEIFVIPGLAWNSHYIPIRGVDHDRRLITVTRRLATRWDRLTKGNRFYVENLLEELDQPGEWCFDSATSTLFFWPPAGSVADGEVTVPVNDRLIELRATHRRTGPLPAVLRPDVHPDAVRIPQPHRPTSRLRGLQPPPPPGDTRSTWRTPSIARSRVAASTRWAATRFGCTDTTPMIGWSTTRWWAWERRVSVSPTWTSGPYDFPPIWRGSAAKLRSMSSRLSWAIGNEIRGNHIHHCGVLDNFGAGHPPARTEPARTT